MSDRRWRVRGGGGGGGCGCWIWPVSCRLMPRNLFLPPPTPPTPPTQTPSSNFLSAFQATCESLMRCRRCPGTSKGWMEDGDHRDGKLVSSAHFVSPGFSAGPNTMMEKSGFVGFHHTVTAAVVKTRPKENLIFCGCLCVCVSCVCSVCVCVRVY